MIPYPCWKNDKFILAISRLLPLFMVIAWIYTVSMMTKDIVYEKEKRLKEFMRVMGLSNGMHWLAWFVTSFAIMYFITFILTLLLKYGEITPFSEISVLFVFFCCFTIATITQCFLFSVFFNKANIAAVIAGILYYVLYLPYTILINYQDVLVTWQMLLASLSSTVAFSYGCDIIASFELQNEGVNWGNFYNNPYIGQDSLSMNHVCLMLLGDSCIYMILAWYIESVFPGEFGVPRRWFFPLQPSYWLGEAFLKNVAISKSRKRKGISYLSAVLLEKWFGIVSKREIILKETLKFKESLEYTSIDDSIEKICENEVLEAGIEIDNLHKVYSRASNHALKGLSVKFFKNEISAFLGHNGAGKSTTMHVLTGLYTPTSGTAKINGNLF